MSQSEVHNHELLKA